MKRKLFYKWHHVPPLQAHGLARRMAREQGQQDQAAQLAFDNGEERVKVLRQQRQVLKLPRLSGLPFVSAHGALFCWP
jgi:hypothetical protein